MMSIDFYIAFLHIVLFSCTSAVDSAAEWLACWTRAQKGPGSNWITVLCKLFTPIVPLFTKQKNW